MTRTQEEKLTAKIRQQARGYFNRIRGLRPCFGPDSITLGWTDASNIIAKVWSKSESEYAGQIVFTKKCIGGCMGDDYECELANGQTVMIYAPAIIKASILDVIRFQLQRKLNGLAPVPGE
jgi:hypothetical protein